MLFLKYTQIIPILYMRTHSLGPIGELVKFTI